MTRCDPVYYQFWSRCGTYLSFPFVFHYYGNYEDIIRDSTILLGFDDDNEMASENIPESAGTLLTAYPLPLSI